MVLVYEFYNFNSVLQKWNFVSCSSHSSPPLVWLKLTQLATQKSLKPRFTKIWIARKWTLPQPNNTRFQKEITSSTRQNVTRHQELSIPSPIPAKARWSTHYSKQTRHARAQQTKLWRLNTTNAPKEIIMEVSTLTSLRIERSLNTWEVSISLPSAPGRSPSWVYLNHDYVIYLRLICI